MSSLGSTTSMYEFSASQANVIGAPVGASMFGEIDQIYSRDNASTKAHFGTSTTDAISYDAANRQFFNDTMALGVDCGRLNVAAGRPNLSVTTGGSACYPASISQQVASRQMDSAYNSYGPSAEQVVLAQGDIRYAPSRFADLNNYSGPSISDDSFQPRLMGTRDAAPSGCSTTMLEQSQGGMSSCSLADNPLPYPSTTDPRVGYGSDSPHTQYWSPIDMAGSAAAAGCSVMNNDSMSSSVCNISSVQGGSAASIPQQYVAAPGGGGGAAARLGLSRPRSPQPNQKGKKQAKVKVNPAVKLRTSPRRR